MSPILTDISTTALTQACEDNFIEFRKFFSGLSGAELHDEEDILWLDTGLPYGKWNGIFRTHLQPENIEHSVLDILAHFRARQLPFSWWIGPSTRPGNLGKYLESQGFALEESSPAMAAVLDNIPEPYPAASELFIRKVENSGDLKLFLEIVQDGFHIPDNALQDLLDLYSQAYAKSQPPFIHFLGLWDGEPTAATSLFLNGRSAGIYNVATLPPARGQGIGTALTTKAMAQARKLGYRVAVLRASDMGRGVYRQLGFREYCKLDQYIFNG
ncbi:MAG: GNAT family N-acetyltransferase [Calditrichia bacterium]